MTDHTQLTLLSAMFNHLSKKVPSSLTIEVIRSNLMYKCHSLVKETNEKLPKWMFNIDTMCPYCFTFWADGKFKQKSQPIKHFAQIKRIKNKPKTMLSKKEQKILDEFKSHKNYKSVGIKCLICCKVSKLPAVGKPEKPKLIVPTKTTVLARNKNKNPSNMLHRNVTLDRSVPKNRYFSYDDSAAKSVKNRRNGKSSNNKKQPKVFLNKKKKSYLTALPDILF